MTDLQEARVKSVDRRIGGLEKHEPRQEPRHDVDRRIGGLERHDPLTVAPA